MKKINLLYSTLLLLLYPFSNISAESVVYPGTSAWAIAITGARNLKRERVATAAELVNLKTRISMKRKLLPGKDVLGVFEDEYSREFRYLIATRDESLDRTKNSDDGIFLIGLTSLLEVSQIKYLSLPPGWKIEKLNFLYNQNGDKLICVVFLSKPEDQQNIGSLCIFEDTNEIINYSYQQIPLPYQPYKVLPIKDEGLWLIIGKDIEEPTICVADAYLKTSRLINIEGINGKICDLFYLDDEHIGIVASSSIEEDLEQSKIYAVKLWNWQIETEPISVWGEIPKNEEGTVKSTYGMWIKTESISDGFGYLSLIQWNPIDGFSKKWETSIIGIEQGWSFAPHPDQLSTIVSVGNKLEIFTDEGTNRISQALDEDITFSLWMKEFCLVASGGKVYQVDTQSGKLIPAMLTQSGWLEKIFIFTQNPQSICDNSKPKIIEFSNIKFKESEIGKHLRTVMLSDSSSKVEEWTVSTLSTTDTNNVLWYLERREDLVLLHLGLMHPQTHYYSIYWLISYNYPSDDSHLPLQSKEHIIQIKSIQKKATPPNILWIFGEGNADFRTSDDPQQLKTLADILAGPPFYFIQDAIATPLQGRLDNYSLVVADAQSLARGIISTSQLSDYIKTGGNVLILGGYFPNSYLQFLCYWLLSLGIQFDPNSLVQGDLPISCDSTYMLRNFTKVKIENGGLLTKISKIRQAELTEVSTESTKSSNPYAFITTNFGKGKIGLLASKYPISSSLIKNPVNLEFALNLFSFLIKSGDIGADADGDNLPDKLEDRNGNQMVDVGETNFLKVDSDGDFIPDDIEDEDLNGIWDENETDPTCNDTDGDSIWDGADISPIPTVKEIVITRIEPSYSPAEGGNMVLVEGRNFSTETKFYFGKKPSPFFRIISPERALVVVPDYQYDQGGIVDVKAVENTLQEFSHNTKKFKYLPRTEVKVKIKNDETNRHCQVIIGTPSLATMSKILLIVKVFEQGTSLSSTVSDNRWEVKITQLKDNWHLITAERKKNFTSLSPLTIDISPIVEPTNKEIEPPKVEKVWILTGFGGRLKVKTE